MKTMRIANRMWPIHLLSVWILVSLALSPIASAEEAPAIPLPAEVAKDLEPLGKGVVGKALPAPPIDDVHEYLNLGAGIWEYQIVEGGKDGKAVRTEQYEVHPEKKDGVEVWKRTVGTAFVEYITVEKDQDFGKHLEDDLDVGYSSRFTPGVVWLHTTKAGETRTIESKIEAFKTAKPDHVSFHGKMTSKLTYVGQYEVKTPAGTFPSVLVRSEFDIKVGPAKVTDTAYLFFSKGVGKVAEIETTHVSAALIYHSNTKVAKILNKYPKR